MLSTLPGGGVRVEVVNREGNDGVRGPVVDKDELSAPKDDCYKVHQ